MEISSFSSQFMDSLLCIAGGEQALTALCLVVALALIGWAVSFFMDFGCVIYQCMKYAACKLYRLCRRLWRKHHS